MTKKINPKKWVHAPGLLANAARASIFAVLLCCIASVANAQCRYNDNFSTAVITGAAQAPQTWYTDRYAPNGFAIETFMGNSRLKHSINTADAAVNRPGLPQAFYNTQGRAYDLVNGQVIKIDLYVPAAWQTSNKRMAGLWGVAYNAANAISGYPIVEFTSDGNFPRFRVYETGTGQFVDLGLPNGFAYNSWVNLKIELLPSGEFRYTINNTLSYTTTSGSPSASVTMKSLILQGHNYSAPDNDPAPDPGVTYDIYWDNLDITQTGDPALGIIDITNTGGTSINANTLATGSAVKLSVPLLNLSQDQVVPTGYATINISLGAKLKVNAGTLAGSPLNSYFSWTTNGALNIITGTQIAPLPIAFDGEAIFDLNVDNCGGAGGNVSVAIAPTCVLGGDNGSNNGPLTLSTAVVDGIIPVITTCPPALAVTGCTPSAITGLAYSTTPVTITVAQFNAAGGVATDNCEVTSASYVDGLPTVTCSTTVVRTFTVSDAAGNVSATCTQTITITNTTPPVVSPATGSSAVECLASATLPTPPTVTDFCNFATITPTVSFVDNPVTITCAGTRVYTFTYTDCGGLVSTYTYTYNIAHITPPVVMPATGSSNVQCVADAIAPLPKPEVADQQYAGNNGRFELNSATGQAFTVGVTGKLTKLDLNVFAVAGTQNITVQIYSGNGPVPANLIYTSPATFAVSATGPLPLVLPVATAPVLIAGNQYTFWISGYSFNNLQLTGGDGSLYGGGNGWDNCNSCTPPNFVATEYPTFDMLFKTNMTPVVTDVCGNELPPVLTITEPTTTCGGTRVFTYTYTDCAGLTSTYVYTYTINDNIAPVITGSIPAATETGCVASAPVTTVAALETLGLAISDNCVADANLLVTSNDVITGTCVKTVTRTYTVTDICLNATTATQVITVTDVTAPVLTIPANITITTAQSTLPSTTGQATAVDACSNGATVTYTDAAGTIYPSSDVLTGPFALEARARNGNSGFEGILFTPGAPGGTQLNPVGAPAWNYAEYHKFNFQYNASTGTTVWEIDFNRDGDFLDANESTSSVSPTLINQGFKYVGLHLQGSSALIFAAVQNVNINGTPVGPFTSPANGTPFEPLYQNSNGQFGNISVTGEVRISGNGNAERPRFWVRAHTPQALSAGPSCPVASVINRLWKAQDACGNASYGVQIITREVANTDVTLGSDLLDNQFTTVGSTVDVAYGVNEIAGKEATPATIRIFKNAGYTVSFDNTLTTGINSYTLDNAKWVLVNVNSSYYELRRTGPGGLDKINCTEGVRVQVRITRNTANISNFNFNSQFRAATGELILSNNSNSLFMVGN